MITDIVQAFSFFIEMMTDAEDALDPNTQRQAIEHIMRLTDVSELKISYYENYKLEGTDEKMDYFIYKDGESDDEEYIDKKVTDISGLAVYRFMHKAGTPPWTRRHRDRLSLLVSIMFVFNSRQMLKQVANRFGYFDDAGYHNLRFFLSQLERLDMIGALKGKAIVHFNLKHFQMVNQQAGRENGDIVMQGFIDGLDEVIDGELPVCRIGGDNFIGLFDYDKVDSVTDYLGGRIIKFGEGYGESARVSATAGIYKLEDDLKFKSPNELMDKVMPVSFAAKSGGKADILFYSAELLDGRRHTIEVQRAFPKALEDEEFLVYYQPKVEIGGCKLVGAEALCRWLHEGELISPARFIPVLESTTDICKLDFYMIEHVCKDIRRWLDEGRPAVRVSVNLSRKHMLDVELLNHLMELIDKYNVPHELIEVELTETTTDVEFKDLKRIVGGLQELGVSASVDDFGIGYSSLNLIKEIPWNVIKIDKSIVPVDEDDEHSPRSVMFKYVVAMAREMGLECIAEGVETKAQVEILRRSGCDVAQGFFFDRPLPKDEFEKRLSLQGSNYKL